MAADPHPGAVMNLPAWPQGESNSPRAFQYAMAHGRPVTAMPRRPIRAVERPLATERLDACRPTKRCTVPPDAPRAWAREGIRYVVVHDLADARGQLAEALAEVIGPPTHGTRTTWWVLDAAWPEDVDTALQLRRHHPSW